MTFLGFPPRFWAALCMLVAVGAVLCLRSLSKRGPLGTTFHRILGASAGVSLLIGTGFLVQRAEGYFASSNAVLLAIPFLIMVAVSLLIVYRMLLAGRETAQRDLQRLVERLP